MKFANLGRLHFPNSTVDDDVCRGVDVYGNDWYIEIDSQGRQLWGQTRGGIVQEGGRNDTPLEWENALPEIESQIEGRQANSGSEEE